jgi:hypothetical protein
MPEGQEIGHEIVMGKEILPPENSSVDGTLEWLERAAEAHQTVPDLLALQQVLKAEGTDLEEK